MPAYRIVLREKADELDKPTHTRAPNSTNHQPDNQLDDQLDDVLHGAGLRLVNMQADGRDTGQQLVFSGPLASKIDGRGTVGDPVVYVVNDRVLALRWILVNAQQSAVAQELAEHLGERLPAYDRDEIDPMLDSDIPEERALGLRLLGLLAGGLDATTQATLEEASRDPSALVRQSGALALQVLQTGLQMTYAEGG